MNPTVVAMVASLSPRSQTVSAWQERAAWVAMAVILVGLVLSVVVMRFRTRDVEQRRQLQALKPQLLAADPETSFVQASESRESWRQTVTAALDGDPPTPRRIGDAVAELKADIARALPPLPVAILHGIVEAGLLVILAGTLGLAMVTVDGWVLPSGGGGLAQIGQLVLAAIVLVGVVVARIVTAVPGGEVVLALRDPSTGAVASVALALVVAGLAAIVGALSADQREQPLQDVRPAVAAVRVGFVLSKLAGAVVSMVLLGALLVDGHLVAAVVTLVAAGPLGWLVLAMVPSVFVAIAYAVSPGATRDIGAALRRAGNAAVVRTTLMLIGIPVVVVVFALLIVAAWTGSIWIGVGGAVVFGLLARGITHLWSVVRFRAFTPGQTDHVISELPVTAATYADADGEAIHVVTVDGYSLAHRDRDRLIDVATDAIGYRIHAPTTDAETPTISDAIVASMDADPRHMPAIEHKFYQRAFEDGEVDFDAVRVELLSDIETRIEASIREAGGEIERDKVLDQLQRHYPEEAIEEALYFLTVSTARVYESQGMLVCR